MPTFKPKPSPCPLGTTWLHVLSFSSITAEIMAQNHYFWLYQHSTQIRVNASIVHLPRIFEVADYVCAFSYAAPYAWDLVDAISILFGMLQFIMLATLPWSDSSLCPVCQ